MGRSSGIMDKKQAILDTVDDLVSNFLWYGRKEDEDLPRGEIEKAIKSGVISIKDITDKFEEELRELL